jgi:hypothetical protein
LNVVNIGLDIICMNTCNFFVGYTSVPPDKFFPCLCVFLFQHNIFTPFPIEKQMIPRFPSGDKINGQTLWGIRGEKSFLVVSRLELE